VCGSPSGYKNPLLLLPVALDKITADYHLDFSDLLTEHILWRQEPVAMKINRGGLN